MQGWHIQRTWHSLIPALGSFLLVLSLAEGSVVLPGRPPMLGRPAKAKKYRDAGGIWVPRLLNKCVDINTCSAWTERERERERQNKTHSPSQSPARHHRAFGWGNQLPSVPQFKRNMLKGMGATEGSIADPSNPTPSSPSTSRTPRKA